MPAWASPFRLALPFGGLLLLVFALLRVVPGAGASRSRLRSAVFLFALYVIVLLATAVAGELGGVVVGQDLRYGAALLALLVGVHLGALLVFEVGLRLLGMRTSDIWHDVAVGAGYVASTFWLMHVLGVNVTGIVATSAVVTAVIGLSLQSTLGGVIGGLALQADNTLREGDWVELENKTQGVIKKVRWRHTVIETREWDTLIVPNNQLVAQTIKVLGRRAGQPVQHRMWVYFNVDHRFSPREVISVVDRALQSAPLECVAAEPKPHAICFDFARDGRDSFVYYAARYWLTDLALDDPTSSKVRERIYAALQRAHIPLALPGAALFLTHDDSDRVERKRQRTLDANRTALHGVALFAQLSEAELTRLAQGVERAPFAAGEVVMLQGAMADWLYVLTSGEVNVLVRTERGAERLVATLKAPAFFGEMAVATGAAREATVVAKGAIECLRVDKDDFRALIAARPELANRVSAILADRRVELEAVRDGLDEAARSRRFDAESSRILSSIKSFFALGD